MERAELRALVRATGCAEERGGFVFLGDPRWGETERARVRVLQASVLENATTPADGWLCVPTGGTSGGLKFARHDERTLSAAVEGFVAHFGLERVNAVDVLPAFHVSGLMARVRCAATGGRHVAWDWRRLEAGERPELERTRGDWVISLVPTQLQRLLASRGAREWLKGFRIVFVGGGPVWRELADAAAAAGLRVSLSYGMTETAAMVAALRPEEFLGGARSVGAVLPHARVTLGEDGGIRIGGASLFIGYFPEGREAEESFATDDLGEFDARGHLHVLGRRDAVIITGGEKVNPTEVEEALRATGEFEDVAVIGMPDSEWGAVVVACYPRSERTPNVQEVERELGAKLAGFKRPKRYVALAEWPRDERGKLSRSRLVAAVQRA